MKQLQDTQRAVQEKAREAKRDDQQDSNARRETPPASAPHAQ
jgi:hypothetical protein